MEAGESIGRASRAAKVEKYEREKFSCRARMSSKFGHIWTTNLNQAHIGGVDSGPRMDLCRVLFLQLGRPIKQHVTQVRKNRTFKKPKGNHLLPPLDFFHRQQILLQCLAKREFAREIRRTSNWRFKRERKRERENRQTNKQQSRFPSLASKVAFE